MFNKRTILRTNVLLTCKKSSDNGVNAMCVAGS